MMVQMMHLMMRLMMQLEHPDDHIMGGCSLNAEKMQPMAPGLLAMTSSLVEIHWPFLQLVAGTPDAEPMAMTWHGNGWIIVVNIGN